MAEPLTATRLVTALRAEGVKVVEVSGWRTNNRNHVGAWGPVNGVMLHHTVTGPKVNAVQMCYDGISNLPGPLCHGVIRRDGSVHLVGNGRANHAGGGDPNVLQAVRDERYTVRPPAPHQHQGSAGAVDGNPHFYGFECENLGDGKDPWPAVQVEAMVRASAAIIRAHRAKGDDWGVEGKSTIGHLEWSDWKSDPKGPDNVVAMPVLRPRIGDRLAHSASWTPGTPVPPTEEDDDMPERVLLTRPDDTTLMPGSEVALYWTQENADTGNQHGDGGKTVATNVTYTGTVLVGISGLLEGEGVEVYPSEENAQGEVAGRGDAHVVRGSGASEGAAPVQDSVPITGSVGQRLVIRVRNLQETPVTLTFARASFLTWTNA